MKMNEAVDPLGNRFPVDLIIPVLFDKTCIRYRTRLVLSRKEDIFYAKPFEYACGSEDAREIFKVLDRWCRVRPREKRKKRLPGSKDGSGF